MTRKERRKKQLLHEKYMREIAARQQGIKPKEKVENFPSFARCAGIYSSVFARY